jgi:anti-sigma B factor antagonist
VASSSDPPLSVVATQPVTGVTVVSLAGELDATTAAELTSVLRALSEDGHVRVVVDASDLAFIDSSGLNALVTGARALAATGGDMVVAGAPAHIDRVFEVVRLTETVTVAASLEDALRGVEAEAGTQKPEAPQ